MDPNATLADILESLRTIDAENSEYEHDSDAGDIKSPSQVADHYDTIAELCESLCERVDALHEWLTRGGFLPDAWNANRAPAPAAPESDVCAECGASVPRTGSLVSRAHGPACSLYSPNAGVTNL